jgi:glucokinase
LGGRRIIGDIGGTNARFAIAEGGKYRELMHVEVARFGSLHDALTDYLNGLPPALRSRLDGALAVAARCSATGWRLRTWAGHFQSATCIEALDWAR